jgi:hypothetical protein
MRKIIEPARAEDSVNINPAMNGQLREGIKL